MLRLSTIPRLVCLGLCAAVFFPQPAFPYGAV